MHTAVNAQPVQAVVAPLIVKPAEHLAHMEAPFVVHCAPVLATPLAHVHTFTRYCCHTVRGGATAAEACIHP